MISSAGASSFVALYVSAEPGKDRREDELPSRNESRHVGGRALDTLVASKPLHFTPDRDVYRYASLQIVASRLERVFAGITHWFFAGRGGSV